MEVSVALQGTLDSFALPDVLRLLAATKKSGRLCLTGERGTGSSWVVAGEVVAVEATHAPQASGPVDALFELLRFEQGSFTFEADALHADPLPPVDVEVVLTEAEALLGEWQSIVAVVPSLDAWVTLRRDLPEETVSIVQSLWTTVVAVGAGATVRRIADDLCLAELPVSRAVKQLVEAGLADIAASGPADTDVGTETAASAPAPLLVSEADAADAAEAAEATAAAPVPSAVALSEDAAPPPGPDAARGPRAARRAKPVATDPAGPGEPERFVPLELPGHAAASYDAAEEPEVAVADLAVAFPGLANHPMDVADDEAGDEDDLARQLATLSPRAADAVRAAAAATSDEERDAALSEADDEDEPLNRGLLLKFLSSVKS